MKEFISAYDKGLEVTKQIITLILERVDASGQPETSTPNIDTTLHDPIDEGGRNVDHIMSMFQCVKAKIKVRLSYYDQVSR